MVVNREIDRSSKGGTGHVRGRSLPDDLRHWVSYEDCTTADQLVEMVERYTVVEDLLGQLHRLRKKPCQALKPTSLPRLPQIHKGLSLSVE